MYTSTDVVVGAAQWTLSSTSTLRLTRSSFRLPSGRADDGQHLAVRSGEHVPIYGGAPVRERQLPAIPVAVETAGHHAGDILCDSSDAGVVGQFKGNPL